MAAGKAPSAAAYAASELTQAPLPARGPPVALFHHTSHATAIRSSQLGEVCG
jgi:hypothetical protein